MKKVATERGVTPCQALFAVFLASLSEAKMLNQATANFLAKSAAPKLYAYLRAMDLLPEPTGDPRHDAEELVKALNRALEIGSRVEIEVHGDTMLIGLGGDECRYCPKSVGLAEIPWAACPFPKLLEGLLRSHGVDATVEPQRGEDGQLRLVVKRQGLCWIKLRLQAGG